MSVSTSNAPKNPPLAADERSRKIKAWSAVPPITRQVAIGILVSVLLAACIFFGYQRIFSTFAVYDDEGYVMISIRSFLAGQPLYDEVYSQYGPGFFVWNSFLFKTLALPLTHDCVRLTTLGIWLTAAAFAAFVVKRLTDNSVLAVGAFLLAFLHLERLVFEPAHPNGLCVLLILGAIAIGVTRSGQTFAKSALAAWGVIVGLLAMTKPNLGVFLAVSLVLLQLLATQRSTVVRVLFLLTLLGGAGLVLLLTRHDLDQPRCLALVLVTLTGMILTASMAWRSPTTQTIELRRMAWFAVPLASCVAAILLWAVAHGTTLYGLAYGLVLQHTSFGARFYSDPPIYTAAVLVVAFAALSAYAPKRWRTPTLDMIRLLSFVALVGIGLRNIADSFQVYDHGADEAAHAALLASFVPPLVWVLLFPPSGTTGEGDQRSGRLALALIACLQPLAAYPNPGTQMAVGSLALLLIAVVVFSDMLRAQRLRDGHADRFGTYSLVGLGAMLLLTVVLRSSVYAQRRACLTPLSLAGASRVRLPDDQAREFQWLTQQIDRYGETFVAHHHAYNSLYFWADVTPPTGLNATLWPSMLTEDQQRQIVAAIEQIDRPVLIRDDSGVWPRDPDTPLVRYLRERFVPIKSRGDLHVLVPAVQSSIERLPSAVEYQ